MSGCLSCVGLCLSLQDIWDAIELSHDSELEKELRGWIPKDPKKYPKKKKEIEAKECRMFSFFGETFFYNHLKEILNKGHLC